MTFDIRNIPIDMTISGLQNHYARGDFSPAELIEAIIENSHAFTENPIWIYQLNTQELTPYLDHLQRTKNQNLPLWGIPFAIKDNIDLKGVPTTAGCKAFSYCPEKSATVVQRLIDAGAIPIGKTNMDQFATGLVGTRSPWGACKNAFNPDVISGGSSSGSAIATALGLVSFALGTDTAGSGRVPAALNNLVGLKPSRGLLSTSGVVPACRSLDCVSIFSLDCDDANTVFNIAAAYDPQDCYSRENPFGNSPRYYHATSNHITLGIPKPSQLEFFGDTVAQTCYDQCCKQLTAAGFTLREMDFLPFINAARLLYQGPWVAERWLATQSILKNQPDAMLPVIHEIISAGDNQSATDAFTAQYQLQAYAQQANQQLKGIDAVLTPTIGTSFSIEEVDNNPIQLNSQLGYYTNFMNLLDYSAVAIPVGFLKNKAGFGITLFSHAFSDKYILSIAAALQNLFKIPPGATTQPFKIQGRNTTPTPGQTVDLLVCGAHLSDQPLNWQLTERQAVLIESTTTSNTYQLYALAGEPPCRPALVRETAGGAEIDVEIWRIPIDNLGSFCAEIPSPLGLGKVELRDGRWVEGFICDHWGLAGAENITQFGGWRKYIQNNHA